MASKSNTIAALNINLTANSIAYNRELERANRKTRDWANDVRQSVNTASKYFAGMGVAATGALAVIYKSAADANDALAKHADKIGISTEALSGLRYQAELNGVSQEKLDLGLQRMVRRVAEAAQGTGEAKNAIKELGLEAETLAKMSPDAQFKAIAEQMQNVGAQSDRVRLGFKLFDSEGVGLINAMRGGADEIERNQEAAEALGIAITRIDAAKIEAANDAVMRSQMAFKGVANTITVELAPLVEAVANKFTSVAASSNGWRDQVIDGIEAVVLSVGYLGNAVRGIEIAFKAAQAGVATFAWGTLETLQTVIDGWVKLYNLVAPKSMEIDPADNLIAIMANEAGLAANRLGDELHALAMKPMPSDGVKAFFDDVRTNANAAAKAVSEASTATQTENTVTTTYDAKAANGVYQVDKWMMSAQEQQQLALTEQWSQNQALLFEAKEAEIMGQVEFEERSLQLQESYLTKQKDLVEKNEKEKAKAREAAAMTALTVVTSNMSLVTDVMEQGGKKQSAVYKFLLAAQKAAAIPSIMVSTQEAALKAEAAFPPPGGTILANSVRASGYAAMGIVAGQAISGAFENGGVVPGNSYKGDNLLAAVNSGEMILNQRQQKQLFDVANGSSTNSGSGVIVNVHTDPSLAVNVQESQGVNKEQVIDIMIADARQNGPYQQAREQMFGDRRIGR